ncbi:2860_t:CDS:2, partial [Scutellospora calospora]
MEEMDISLPFKRLFDALKIESCSEDLETNDIRVVAAIDFGTTYSGYAYAHLKSNPLDIVTCVDWSDYDGMIKQPTVLMYDESFKVINWGYPALINLDPKDQNNMKPVELFKLYLGNIDKEKMPYLPSGIDYEKAITDYLRCIGESLKDRLKNTWQQFDYFKNVRLVMTVPVEFDNDAISTMRKCAYEAGLTKQKHNSNGSNLLFVHEPEAAAVHCFKTDEYDLSVGDTFMVVDSGGGTVDITTMKLLEGGKLSEKIESKGDYCGGSYVDKEFLKFLGQKIGDSTIEILKESHYRRMQNILHKFRKRVKHRFTGKPDDFTEFELDLEALCSVIKQYVKGTIKDELESSMWVITIKYEDVKKMFDPVIDKIIKLIHGRLETLNCHCTTMLLVGGFSESKYLVSRIRAEFKNIVPNISVPSNPMLAVVKGAVRYGSSQKIIVDRILKWTYGTDIVRKWMPDDPLDRKIDEHIKIFSRLAKRGHRVKVGEKVIKIFSTTHVFQHMMGLDIYVTREEDAEYCDSPGVNLLDQFNIKVPINGVEKRPILYVMKFGMVEIQITAINTDNGMKYER